MIREPKYPVQTVMKAIEIINLLAKEGGGQGLGVSEFSKELEMGKSTVHRLLDTLQFYGYIEKDEESSRYRLGWELYKIGQRIPQQNQLFNLSPNYLMELSRRTQETVNMGILKRGETVLISKIEGSRDALRVSVNPGEYESIHATGIGKALICEMSEAEVRELLNGREILTVYTAHTIARTEDLLTELRQVRQLGDGVPGPVPKRLKAGNYFAEQRHFNLGLQANGFNFNQFLAVRGETVDLVPYPLLTLPSKRVV